MYVFWIEFRLTGNQGSDTKEERGERPQKMHQMDSPQPVKDFVIFPGGLLIRITVAIGLSVLHFF